MDKAYLKAAKKEIKRIAKEIGHSPTSFEYRKHAGKEYKFKQLADHDLTLNKLKTLANLPVNNKGFKKAQGEYIARGSIFCISSNNKIPRGDCVPYYKAICSTCKFIQKKNKRSVPDLTPEEQKEEINLAALGNKHYAGNEIYLVNIGII